MRLIAFAGPACAGKSTLAAELSRRAGWPHLSMDATRQRILPDAAHTRADRVTAYRAMHFAAELLLASGVSVIVDAQYSRDEDRLDPAVIAARTGAAVQWIEVQVTPEEAAARWRARGYDKERPDLTAETVARMAREYDYRGTGMVVGGAGLDTILTGLGIE